MTELRLTDEQVLVIRAALMQGASGQISAETELTFGEVLEARGGILRQLDAGRATFTEQ